VSIMIDLANDENRQEIKKILENDLISMTNLCKHYGVRTKKMRTVCKQHNITPIAILDDREYYCKSDFKGIIVKSHVTSIDDLPYITDSIITK